MEQGLSLEEMSILARCNGLYTQTFRADEFDEYQSILKSKKISMIDQDLIEHSKDHINCVHNKLNQIKGPNCCDNKIGFGSSTIHQYDLSLFKTMI